MKEAFEELMHTFPGKAVGLAFQPPSELNNNIAVVRIVVSWVMPEPPFQVITATGLGAVDDLDEIITALNVEIAKSEEVARKEIFAGPNRVQ